MNILIDKEATLNVIRSFISSLRPEATGLITDIYDAVLHMPSTQSEPAIPLSWIEAQIEWLKSLDNAFSTLTAGQISAMVNKWKDEQDE